MNRCRGSTRLLRLGCREPSLEEVLVGKVDVDGRCGVGVRISARDRAIEAPGEGKCSSSNSASSDSLGDLRRRPSNTVGERSSSPVVLPSVLLVALVLSLRSGELDSRRRRRRRERSLHLRS